jgi:hypothetical protein
MTIDLYALVDRSIELSDSDRADIDALQASLNALLTSDDEDRREQVLAKLADESPWEVARFASYFLQTKRLKLHPWQNVPAHIHTRKNAEAVLAKGPLIGSSGDDVSDCALAQLTIAMCDAGISRWHPDPIAALREAA